MIKIQGTKQKEETYALIASAWDEIEIGESFQIVQSNELGGKSLEKRLGKLFSQVDAESYDKARHIILTKTKDEPDVLDEWRSYNQLSYCTDIGFYSMPGIFGWNKIDKGSELLLTHLSELKGVGADFGCGYGYLTKHILNTYDKIETLYAYDIDDRAVMACGKNIDDPRVIIRQQDCTEIISGLQKLDFIVMNPPFHDGSFESKELGQKFIENAARHLKPKGRLWMVANTHLPYEKILAKNFKSFKKIFEDQGFKIFKT